MADFCRRHGCGAQIMWLLNETTGKSAPIDAEPVWGGNIEVLADPDTGEITRYRIVAKDDRKRQPYHKNHFASCSNPPDRSKRRTTNVKVREGRL